MNITGIKRFFAAAALAIAAVAPSKAEVFSHSYDVQPCDDWVLLTEMLVGPGVSLHPSGRAIPQSNFNQIGVFSNLVAQVVPTFTNGVILSTSLIEYGNTPSNVWMRAPWEDEAMPVVAGGIDNDLSSYFPRKNLGDPAGIILYIQPKYTTINIPFLMASEDFYRATSTPATNKPSRVWYNTYSDVFAFFLQELADADDPAAYDALGNVIDNDDLMTYNIAKLDPEHGGGDIEISSVNQHTNTDYFVSNVATNIDGTLIFPADDILLPMEFNGAIKGPVAIADVDTNKIYKLKIIIADTYDNLGTSAVFLRERGITSGADLKVEVTGPEVLIPPGTATFTDTVTNVGPVKADGVEVVHYLPEGVDPLGVTVAPAIGSVDPASWGVENGTNYFVWAIGDGFMPGAAASMTITCDLGEGAYTNVATVATATGDYEPANDRSELVTLSGNLPALTVEAVSITKKYGEEINLPDMEFILSIDGTNTTQIATGVDVSFTNALGEAVYPTNATTAVGTYSICLAGLRGFDLSFFTGGVTYIPGTLTILPAEVTLEANSDTKTYDGTEKTVTGYTCSVPGLAFDGVAASGSGTNAGDYPVTFSGVTIGTTKDTTGNYVVSGTTDGTLTILPAEATLTANSDTKTYDGTEKTVTGYTCSVPGLAFDGVAASGSGTNAGNYPVTFSGVTIGATKDTTGNYVVSGTTDGTLTIVPAEVTLTANSGSETYDGTEKTLAGYTCSVAGLTFAGVTASGSGTNAGDYPVTFSGVTVGTTKDTTGNYVVSETVDGTLTIVSANVTLTANSDTKTYDGTEKTVTGYTCSVAGLTFTGVTASGSGTNAGIYPVTFSGVTVGTTKDTTGNYVVSGTTDGTLTIVSAEVTLTANSDTKTYDGTEKTVTGYTCSVPGLVFDGVAASGSGTNAGGYPVTFTGVTVGTTKDSTGNYVVSGTTDGTLTIVPAEVTLTANSGSETYDGTEKTVSGYTCSVPGIVFDGVTASGSGTDAGTYDVKFSGVVLNDTKDSTGNYVVAQTIDGTLTIAKRQLVVKANNQTKAYGAVKMFFGTEFSIVQGSLVAPDSLSDMRVTLTCDKYGDANAAVGFYPDEIVAAAPVSGIAAGNYEITYQPGDLTVTPKAVTITAGSDTKVYDGTPLTVSSFDVAGLGSGDSHQFAVTMTADSTITDVGTQPNVVWKVDGVEVSATAATSVGNYLVTIVAGQLEVTQAAMTIRVDGDTGSKVYNGAEQSRDGVVTPTSQTAGFDATKFSYGGSTTASGKDAGEYTTQLDAASCSYSDANYAVTWDVGDPVKLVIDPKAVTITAKDAEKPYDGTLLTEGGFEATPLEDGDTHVFAVEMTADSTITDVGTQPNVIAKVDGVDITPVAATRVGNYSVTTAPGTLTVTKRQLVVKANNQTKAYGAVKMFFGTEFSIVQGSLVAPDSLSDMRVTLTCDKYGDGNAAVGNYPGEIVASNATGINVGNYEITYQPGDLTVTPKAVTITAGSDIKVYDGTPLTAGTFDVAGLGSGDSHQFAVTMTAESTITDVGTQPNVVWKVDGVEVSAAAATPVGNYLVTIVAGQLEVTQAAMTIRVDGDSGSKVYNGAEQSRDGVVTATSQTAGFDATKFSYSGSTTASGKDAGEYTTQLDAASCSYSDANYAVTWDVGDPVKFVIEPKAVTITAKDAEKPYDGTPLTEGGFDSTPLEDGDTHVFAVDMTADSTITDVGTQPNVIAKVDGVDITPVAATRVGNYSVTTAPGTLTVTKRQLAVKANNQTKAYGAVKMFFGTEFSIVQGSLVSPDSLSNMRVTLTCDKYGDGNAAVGNYPGEIVASAATGINVGNYEIMYQPGDLTVTPKAVTITAGSDTKVYDGTPLTVGTFTVTGLGSGDSHQFAVEMTAESMITDVGTQPNVVWKVDGVEVSATAATPVGNYLVTIVAGQLEVTQAAMTIRVDGDTGSKVYNGAEQSRDGVVTATSQSAGFDATKFSYNGSTTASGKDAGEYTTQLDAASCSYSDANYAVTWDVGDPVKLVIDPKAVTITAKDAEKPYDGTPLTEGGFYSTPLEDGDTHVFAVEMTADSTITDVGTQPNVIAKVDGVDITPVAATRVGNYSVTTVDGTLTVTKRQLVVKANNQTKAYGAVKMFFGTEFSIVQGSLVAPDSLSDMRVTLTCDKYGDGNAAVGNYPGEIVASDATGIDLGKYEITYQPGDLTVTPKAVTITAGSDTKVYDGTPLTVSTFDVTGLGSGDSHQFAVTMTADSTITDVGTQPNVIWKVDGVEVSATAATPVGNYLVTIVAGQLEVTQAAMTIRVDGDSGSKVYNGAEQSRDGVVTATSQTAGFDATKFSYGGSTTASGKDAGEYATQLDAASCSYSDANYAVTWDVGDPVKLVIDPKAVTITAKDAEKPYDGTPLTEGGFEATPLEDGDTHVFAVDMTADSTITDVGTQPNVIAKVDGVDITPVAATRVGNYSVTTAPGTLTVTKRQLVVKANNQTKAYGAVKMFFGTEFSIVQGSLVAPDSLSDMRVTLTCDKYGDGNAAVGNYPGDIVASAATGIDLGKYEITYQPGDLTVTPKAVTITAGSDTKVYDGTPLTVGTFDVAGMGSGDSHQFAVTMTEESTITDVGTQPNVVWKVDGVEVSATAATPVGNYLVTIVAGQLEVTQAAMTIRVDGDSASKVYNGAEQSRDGVVTATSQTAGFDATKFSYSGSTTASGKDAGEYTTQLDAASCSYSDANYAVTWVVGDPVKLVIDPKAVTITAKDAEKTYDGTPLTEGGFEATPLEDGDTHVFAVDMTADSTITDVGTQPNVIAKVDGVDITPVAATRVGNYSVTTVDGTLTVTKRQLVVKANNQTKAYGAVKMFSGTEFSIVQGSLVAPDSLSDMRVTLTCDKYGDPATPVGNYPGEIVASAATGIDVGKYEITYQPGDLTVTPQAVTITAGSDTKVYDGMPLTVVTFDVTGMGSGDSHQFAVTMTEESTITDVGTQPNVIWKVDGVEVSATAATPVGNYLVTIAAGQLEVTQAAMTIRVDGDSASKVYTGAVQSHVGTVTATSQTQRFDATKFSYSGSTTASGKDVGEYTTALVEASCSYNDSNFAVTWDVGDPVKLEITPAELTVNVNGSGTRRVYNGAEQHYEGTVAATCAAAGFDASKFSYIGGKTVSGKDVGSYDTPLSPNSCRYNDRNYSVVWRVGTPVRLTIVPAELTVTVNGSGERVVYNGAEQTYEGTVTATGTGAAFDASKFGYAGGRIVSGTDAGDYELPLSPNSCVYSDQNYAVTWVIGDPIRLAIAPAPVTITARDASKTYDGTALTESGFDVEGLPQGDAHEFAVEMTPESTITDVGKAANVIATVDGVAMQPGSETVAGNYAVSIAEGELEIMAAGMVVRIDGDATRLVYNGNLQSHEGVVTATSASQVFDATKFSYIGSTTVSGRDVGQYSTPLDAASCRYGDANYTVTWEVGEPVSLEIDPAALVIVVTGSSDRRVYDATEQSYEGTVTATSANAGFDASKFGYSGDRTVAGTDADDYETPLSPNSCSYSDQNYTVAWEIGSGVRLSISPAPVTLTANDAGKEYDGAPLTEGGFEVEGQPESDSHVFSVEMTADSTITDVGVQPNVIGMVDGVAVSPEFETLVGNYMVSILPGALTVEGGAGGAGAPLTTLIEGSLNWDTGLIDLVFTITNDGPGPIDADSDYWVELQPGAAAVGVPVTYCLYSPEGTLPNGREYAVITSVVKAALKAAGNRDESFDPGETVKVGGVSVYHWKRWSPEKFIDPEDFLFTGRLSEVVDDESTGANGSYGATLSAYNVAETVVKSAGAGFTAKTTAYGALADGERIAGIVQFTVGAKKKGKCAVSGSVTGLDGKARKIKSVKLNVTDWHGESVLILDGAKVTGSGDTLSAVIGADGVIEGVFGGLDIVPAYAGATPGAALAFSIDEPLETLAGEDVLQAVSDGGATIDLLPFDGAGERISVASTGKWKVAAKPGRVKVAKDGAVEAIPASAKGGDTNWSALKIAYNAKKGTFKGSFVAYTLVNGKLKKYKFTVTGVAVNGVGVGIAVNKKSGVTVGVTIKEM